MAKGNDGHVLQHGLLCALAERMAVEGDLLFIDTHAMAPWEPYDARDLGSGLRAVIKMVSAPSFVSWVTSARPLRWLRRLFPSTDPTYVRALRAVTIDGIDLTDKYPNSLVLVQALVPRVRAMVCELDHKKYAAILDWIDRNDLGSRVTALWLSWRRRLGVGPEPGEPKNVYDDDDAPWILSLDPYTYHEGNRNHRDSADLFSGDLIADSRADIRSVIIRRSLMNPRFRAGLVASFTYAMSENSIANLHVHVDKLLTDVTERTNHQWKRQCVTRDLRSGHQGHRLAHACVVHPTAIAKQVDGAFKEYRGLPGS